MVEAISAGATIGFIALILFDEFELKLCRLCTCFWLSVLYCVVSGNWVAIGVVNIAAHVSYLTLNKVAYHDPYNNVSNGSSETTSQDVRGGQDHAA